MSIFDIEHTRLTFEQMSEIPNSLFVHENDQLIQKLINCHKDGPWIAGGACLSWYQNTPTSSDIDVYFADEEQFSIAELAMKRFKYSEILFYSKNALTFSLTHAEKKWTVQLIRTQFYPNLKAVISNFDITVCQIGWDGRAITVGDYFVHDVANRVLRFQNISPQSHKRLVKYMCYGYKPVDNCIEQLIQSSSIDWNAKGSDHYA